MFRRRRIRARIRREHAELDRFFESRESDAQRPLMSRLMIRELSEIYIRRGSETEIDGQYLHDLLQQLQEELEFLMLVDHKGRQQLAHVHANVVNAKGWAWEYGVKKNALYVLDRRRFRTREGEDVKYMNMIDWLKEVAKREKDNAED